MENRIMTLRRTLGTMREIRFAYLFGEQVNGCAGDLSDFGVAVFLKARRPDFSRRLVVMERLADLLGTTAFDFVVLNDAPILTNRTIARHGLVVKDEPREREVFQIKLHQAGEHPVAPVEAFWSFSGAADADFDEIPGLTLQS